MKFQRNEKFAGVLCHTLMTREIECEDIKPREFCFKVRDVSLRFGDWEFELLSGLRFGDVKTFHSKFNELRKKFRFRNKYFLNHPTPTVKDVASIFMERDWKNEDNEDAVSFAMLYFALGTVLENTDSKPVPTWVLELAEFPKLFQEYPWGVVGWDGTYKTLVKGLTAGGRRLDDLCAHRAAKKSGEKAKRVPYNLCGLAHIFTAWLIEVWEAPRKWFTKTSDCIPRWFRWKNTAKLLTYREVLTAFEKDKAPNNSKLEGEEADKQCNWYQPLVDHVEGRPFKYDDLFVGLEVGGGGEGDEDGGACEEEGDEDEGNDYVNNFEVVRRVQKQKQTQPADITQYIDGVIKRMFANHEEKMDKIFANHEEKVDKKFAALGERIKAIETDVQQLKAQGTVDPLMIYDNSFLNDDAKDGDDYSTDDDEIFKEKEVEEQKRKEKELEEHKRKEKELEDQEKEVEEQRRKEKEVEEQKRKEKEVEEQKRKEKEVEEENKRKENEEKEQKKKEEELERKKKEEKKREQKEDEEKKRKENEVKEHKKEELERKKEEKKKKQEDEEKKRKDAAIDALKPMGFPEPLIRKTVRNLLKAYGGDEGWIFIEEFSYKLLIDSILEEVEEKNNVLRLPENTKPTLMIENQVPSSQSTLMIENQVSKDNTDQYNAHSNQVEPSRSSSPPLKKRAVQVHNPSNSSSTLTLAVPCPSKEEMSSEVKCRKQIALSKVSAGIRSLQVKACSPTKNVSTEIRSPQLFSPAIVESRPAESRKPCYGWLSSDEDDEPD